MEKRYKFRIYPSKEQERVIHVNFNCSRFIYNHYLAKQIETYKEKGTYTGLFDVSKTLPQLKRTSGYEWLSEAVAEALSYALCDLDNAFKMFFKRVKQGDVAPGFPKFKHKKSSFQSYRCKNKIPKAPKMAHAISVGENKIRLPKLGWVDCRVSKQIEGRILSATVLQAPSGKYFVSLYCTEVECTSLPQTNSSVGLHLGIENLAVSSDGERFENHRYLERSQEKLNRLQKRLARKSSGSSNYEKARKKLARGYEKIINQKTDNLHKLTTGLVRNNDTICVRDEQVAEKQRNRIYSKQLADAGWGEFVRMLSYKSQWYGKELVKIPKTSPSAQLCSKCGYKHKGLKPYHYEWDCPKCGEHHDRRVNAAANVLSEGLKIRPGRSEFMSAEEA